MELIDAYRAILSAGSLHADTAGYVSSKVRAETFPYTLGERRVVLPTREHLDNTDKSKIIVFHPLRESIARGESEIFTRFRQTVNSWVNTLTRELFRELLSLGASPAEQQRMSPQQQRVLTPLRNVDDKTMGRWTQLENAMKKGSAERCLVNILVKQRVIVDGKQFARGAVTYFPLYEELKKGVKNPWGVILTKADIATLTELYEFVFDSVATEGAYNYGCVGHVAPSLEALLNAAHHLRVNMSCLVKEYEEFIHNADLFEYDTTWMQVFENIGALLPKINAVPAQSGNEGSVPSAGPTAAQIAQSQAQTPVVISPAVQAPPVVTAPAPAAVASAAPATPAPAPAPAGDSVSFVSHLNTHVPAAAAGMYPGMAYPGMMYPGMVPQIGPASARAATGGMGLLSLLPPANPQPYAAGVPGQYPAMMPGQAPLMPGMPQPSMMPMQYPNMLPAMQPQQLLPGMQPQQLMPGQYPGVMQPMMQQMPILAPNDPTIYTLINQGRGQQLNPQQVMVLPNGQQVYVHAYLSGQVR